MVRLRLNMCARGDSISALTDLSSLELIPSKSVLDLPTMSFIVSPTQQGPVPARSSGGKSGWSVQYERGSMLEGCIVSEIDVPIVEKKLLNAFAISVGLDVREPLDSIAEIEDCIPSV